MNKAVFPLIRKSLKHFVKVAEFCAALFAVVLLAVSLVTFAVFWKLSHGPVDMTWAEPYIQSALGGDKAGVEVEIDGMVAEWKSFDSPLTLGIADLSVKEQGHEILSVSQVGLQLARLPLLVGIVSPESIYIKNPSIQFEKSVDGQLSFMIANKSAEQPEPSELSQKKMSPEEIGNSLFLGGLLNDDSRLPLSRLKSFVIKNASVTIDDKAQGKVFSLPDSNLSLKRDRNDVTLVLDYQAEKNERSKLNAVVVRKPLQDKINFTLNLDNIATGLWALNLPSLPGLMRENYTFDGQISGAFDTEWTLEQLDGTIATAHNGVEQQKFKIGATRAADTGIIPLELSLEEVSLDQIASVWPQELSHLNITEWFTKKLSKGVIKDFAIQVPFKNEAGKWTIAGDVSGTLKFENLTCDYRAPLYPLSEGYGHAVIGDDTLTITVDKAKLENMDVTKGSIVITKLTAPDHEVGEAQVKLNLKGPLSTAFKYIALEPISLGDKIKMDPTKVEGHGDIDVTVTFPTLADLPADEVKAVVDATLTDTKLPGIVRGMTLSGGPLALKVDKGAFSITGNGLLEGTPMEFGYSEYLNPEGAPYSSNVQAKLVTDDEMRKKFGIDITDYVAGKAGVDLNYTQRNNGMTDIDLKADLTPGQVFVKPLNYAKKEGVPAAATAKLLLKGDVIQKLSDLNVTIGKDYAKGGQLTFGTVGKENNVTAASFDAIKLGEANDLKLKISQTASVLKMDVSGNSLDARGFLGKTDTSSTPRSRDVDVTVKTNVMRMDDARDEILKSPVMRAVVNPAGEVKSLDLKARVGEGAGTLAVNMTPSSKGVMNLRMDSNDAGAALKALGVYSNMVGGTLALSGSQMQGGQINDIEGAALISNFKIVKAPALAKLIGAFSITGLPELLANDGISFTKLKSNFIWRGTRKGDRIINVYDGATSGGSVGLTFGGVVNQTKDTIDISGTFVPISQINKIVSSIPLVGQLLTGGKNGGIIAATYTFKGPSSDPSVMVNPLSVLAPGFLRSILFEGGLNSGRDEKPITPKKKTQAARSPNN